MLGIDGKCRVLKAGDTCPEGAAGISELTRLDMSQKDNIMVLRERH
jgi:hypothetical protein